MPSFATVDGRLVIEMWFTRTGPALPNEAIFFHLLNAAGDIVGQLDRPLCRQCAIAPRSTWSERFIVPRRFEGRLKHIAFGVYDLVQPRLVITGLETDGGGLRARVQVPKP